MTTPREVDAAAERIDVLLNLEDHRRALTAENTRLRRELDELRSGVFITALLALMFGVALGAAAALAATHWATPLIDWMVTR